MVKDVRGFSLLAFRGKMKVLHMSWMAFFVTFVVWFNQRPAHGGQSKARWA